MLPMQRHGAGITFVNAKKDNTENKILNSIIR